MKIINRLFRENFWVSYYRKESKSINSIVQNQNPWHKVLVNSERYWCADPFIVEDKGIKYIFCELMDRKTSRGLLGYNKLNEFGDTKIKFLLDLGCHTSYPNVFNYEGSWYMIPETSARLTIELYKAITFPYHWEKVGDLINGRFAVDTTVFIKDSSLYVFIYEPNGLENKLSMAELDVRQCKLLNERKLLDYPQKIGRPGGNIISEMDNEYRVTQSGENIYGEKLVFKRFSIAPKYEEEDVVELYPSDFHLTDKIDFVGTHTYNRCGGYEIVDFRYFKYKWIKPLEAICKLFKLFGYTFEKQWK